MRIGMHPVAMEVGDDPDSPATASFAKAETLCPETRADPEDLRDCTVRGDV